MKIAIYGQRLEDNYLSFIQVLFQDLLNKGVDVVVSEIFYKDLSDSDFEDDLDYIKIKDIRKTLKTNIKKVANEISIAIPK